MYSLVYEFQVATGQLVRSQSRTSFASPERPGSLVEIAYDPQQPHVTYIIEQAREQAKMGRMLGWMLVAMAVGSLLGAAAVGAGALLA